jgi:hypothetical protein
MIKKINAAMAKPLPRWFRRASVVLTATAMALGILLLGVQLGLWHERSKQTATAITAELEKKDRQADALKISLNIMQYDLDIEKEKLNIIICESGGRKGIWGDGGKSHGCAQFQRPTFTWMKKEAKRPDLQWKKWADQLWLLDWALRHGYGKHWTCYRKGGQI